MTAMPDLYATPAPPVKVHALKPDMKELSPATSHGMRLPPRKYSDAVLLKRMTYNPTPIMSRR